MKILLLSHGASARGMMSGYSMIAGNNENISYIELDNHGIGTFTTKVNEYLTKEKEQVLIICDLTGGTPYNVAFKYYLENPDKVKVVSGMNLSMILELGTSKLDNLDSAVEIAKQAGIEGIKVAQDNVEDNDLDF